MPQQAESGKRVWGVWGDTDAEEVGLAAEVLDALTTGNNDTADAKLTASLRTLADQPGNPSRYVREKREPPLPLLGEFCTRSPVGRVHAAVDSSSVMLCHAPTLSPHTHVCVSVHTTATNPPEAGRGSDASDTH